MSCVKDEIPYAFSICTVCTYSRYSMHLYVLRSQKGTKKVESSRGKTTRPVPTSRALHITNVSYLYLEPKEKSKRPLLLHAPAILILRCRARLLGVFWDFEDERGRYFPGYFPGPSTRAPHLQIRNFKTNDKHITIYTTHYTKWRVFKDARSNRMCW